MTSSCDRFVTSQNIVSRKYSALGYIQAVYAWVWILLQSTVTMKCLHHRGDRHLKIKELSENVLEKSSFICKHFQVTAVSLLNIWLWIYLKIFSNDSGVILWGSQFKMPRLVITYSQVSVPMPTFPMHVKTSSSSHFGRLLPWACRK